MKVSVIVPVFNAAPYVEAAVASILRQREVVEVLLVEDGSQDDSLQICQRLVNTSVAVKLFRHPEGVNLGASASRNLGIVSATCSIIAFLDADDLYLPGRFSTPAEILESQPDCDGVHEAVDVAFESGPARDEWFRRNRFTLNGLSRAVPPEALLSELLSNRGYFHLNSLTLRKRAAESVGLFNTELSLVEDTDFCIRLACKCRLVSGRLREPVATRRIHGDNTIMGPMWQHRRQRIVRMWKLLFAWCLTTSCTQPQIEGIADAYLGAAERGDGNNRILARWGLRGRVLAEVLLRNPRSALRRYWWRHAVRALNLTKARYVMSGVPKT